MKTHVFKLLAPVLFAGVGIAGAFVTTSAQDEASLSLVDGYRPFQGNPCHMEQKCETQFNVDACTLIGSPSIQLWGKENPNDVTCPVRLYRVP